MNTSIDRLSSYDKRDELVDFFVQGVSSEPGMISYISSILAADTYARQKIYTDICEGVECSIMMIRPANGYLIYEFFWYDVSENYHQKSPLLAHFILSDTSYVYEQAIHNDVDQHDKDIFDIHKTIVPYDIPVFDLRHRKLYQHDSKDRLRGSEYMCIIESFLHGLIRRGQTKSLHLSLSTQQYGVFKRAVSKLGMHLVGGPGIHATNVFQAREELLEYSWFGQEIDLINSFQSPRNPEGKSGPYFELLKNTMTINDQILRVSLIKSLVQDNAAGELVGVLA